MFCATRQIAPLFSVNFGSPYSFSFEEVRRGLPSGKATLFLRCVLGFKFYGAGFSTTHLGQFILSSERCCALSSLPTLDGS